MNFGVKQVEKYHHKFESTNPLSSDNLINYIENNMKEEEEIYLLLNDIDTLKVQLHDQEIMNSRAKKEIKYYD